MHSIYSNRHKSEGEGEIFWIRQCSVQEGDISWIRQCSVRKGNYSSANEINNDFFMKYTIL